MCRFPLSPVLKTTRFVRESVEETNVKQLRNRDDYTKMRKENFRTCSILCILIRKKLYSQLISVWPYGDAPEILHSVHI